jgi:F-type H+-transporting ATPase subunit delta
MIVADRYASSLMGFAAEMGKVDAVREDMKLISSVYKQNRDFALMVDSPVIKTDKKMAVMIDIFKGKISDLTLSFVLLVARKNRESYLRHIATSFEEQYKKNNNIFTAVVTTAKGLDATTRQKMLDLVKSQMKGEVELVEKVDASTIGGFILKIGDRQMDRSVAKQLSNLKKEFINRNLN